MSKKSAWIVIEVHSGIPIEVKAFSEQKNATKYLETIRENLNLNNDETGIFEIEFPID